MDGQPHTRYPGPLDEEIENAGRDLLAVKLWQGGRTDKLLRLFDDDRRLLRRVDPSERVWDGYQEDLELAQDALARTLADPAADPRRGLSGSVRLALVRSALTTVDRMPSTLVSAAVRTGHWSARRALSTIARYPSPDYRAEAYLRLLALPGLDEETRRSVEAQVIDLANLPPHTTPGRTLIDGLTFTTPHLRRQLAKAFASNTEIAATSQAAMISGRKNSVIASRMVHAMHRFPEIRSTELITRVGRALLDAADELARRRDESTESSERTDHERVSLLDKQYKELTEAFYGPAGARKEIWTAMCEWAEFLPAHANPAAALAEVQQLMVDVEDEWLRGQVQAAYGSAARELHLTWTSPPSEPESGGTVSQAEEDRDRSAWLIQEMLSRRREGPSALLHDEEDLHYPVWTMDALISQWAGMHLARLTSPTGESNSDEVPGGDALAREGRRGAERQTPSPDAEHDESVGRRSRVGQAVVDGFLRVLRRLHLDGEQQATDTHAVKQWMAKQLRRRMPRSWQKENREADNELVVEHLVKVGGPSFIAAFATAHDLSGELIDQLVEDAYTPDEFDGQLMIAHFIGGQERGTVDMRPAFRRISGALLRCRLADAYRNGWLATAWAGLDPETFSDADFTPVVNFITELPAEPSREGLADLTGPSGPPDVTNVPRLQALQVAARYLDGLQLDRALRSAINIPDREVRFLALENLSTRLDAGQVADAIAALDVPSDSREQVWAIRELANKFDLADPRRRTVEEWVTDAIRQMRQGAEFADAVLHGRAKDPRILTEVLGEPSILETLRAMDVNNRSDALRYLSLHGSDELPRDLVAEILALPTVNDKRTYSWRGRVLAGAAHRLPENLMDDIWSAVKELPERLEIGDSQAWGWHWHHEYQLASTVHELAPRLRGQLALEAFEVAKRHPWFVREEIVRKLAENADAQLAAVIFDHSIELHRTYLAIRDDARPPVPLENTVVMEAVSVFKIRREVQLAEIIAAVADRLDPERLRRAVDQALAFTNEGPRAWLPPRLLPHLAGSPEPLLSSAFLAAIEFVGADPSRLDLITDLMPEVQREIERRAEPVRRFLADHISGGAPLIIPEEQVRSLPVAAQSEYLRLIGLTDMRTTVEDGPSGEAELRRLMAQWILSPVAAARLQELLASTLARAPVPSRVAALDSMREVLEPELHAAIVRTTLDQLRNADLPEPDRVIGIKKILPYLDQADRDALVDLLPHFAEQSYDDDETLGRRAFNELYQDWGKALRSHPRFTDHWHNIGARLMMQDFEQREMRRAYDLRSDRVALLSALAPELSPAAVRRAAAMVLSLHELERADAVAVLLPVADSELQCTLLEVLTAGLQSPFARFWALFNSQRHLDPIPTELGDIAWSTALAFKEPLNVIACMVMLIGLSGESRPDWLNFAFDQLDQLSDEHALKVLSLLTHLAGGDQDLNARVLARVESLSTNEAYRDGLLMLARQDVDILRVSGVDEGRIRLFVANFLSELAPRGRPEFLKGVAEAAPLLAALGDEDDVLAMAEAVHQVCHRWRWP